MHRLAYDELRFLQMRGMKVEAPTSGPVQTDDLADSVIVVVTDLLAQETAIRRALDESRPRFVRGAPASLPRSDPLAQRLSAAGRGPDLRGTMRMTDRPRGWRSWIPGAPAERGRTAAKGGAR